MTFNARFAAIAYFCRERNRFASPSEELIPPERVCFSIAIRYIANTAAKKGVRKG